MHSPLSPQTESLAKEVVDIAFQIHKELGPGLLERVYEKCFCHELERREISYTRQQAVEIIYKDLTIGDGLRIDIFVSNEIIIELKAQENFHPVGKRNCLAN